jgi:hypothetical protein
MLEDGIFGVAWGSCCADIEEKLPGGTWRRKTDAAYAFLAYTLRDGRELLGISRPAHLPVTFMCALSGEFDGLRWSFPVDSKNIERVFAQIEGACGPFLPEQRDRRGNILYLQRPGFVITVIVSGGRSARRNITAIVGYHRRELSLPAAPARRLPWQCVGGISPATGGRCSGCGRQIPAFRGITKAIEEELRELIDQGETITATKRLRAVSGSSLAKAKLWAEHGWPCRGD